MNFFVPIEIGTAFENTSALSAGQECVVGRVHRSLVPLGCTSRLERTTTYIAEEWPLGSMRCLKHQRHTDR